MTGKQIATLALSAALSALVSFFVTNRNIQANRKDKLAERLQNHGEEIAKLLDRTNNYKEIEKIVYSGRVDDQSREEITSEE